MADFYDELASLYSQKGTEGALEALVDELRREKRYHELFEALKMRIRGQVGLPLLYSEGGDALPVGQRNLLEEALLEACREVGTLLLAEGRLREGWMYLRPVGDKAEAVRLLTAIDATDENTEELIEVLLREGIDPARGFELVLENYGTCNAITTFDAELSRFDKGAQRAGARLLVMRLHADLLANVRLDIARQEGSEPCATTLEELVAGRDWLFAENAYHIDTTHLASTVRAARLLADARDLQLALDLTHYGRRLSAQFQYPADEPFADQYVAAGWWFGAQLGRDVAGALAYFRERAEKCQPEQEGTQAVEYYTELLCRLGRYAEAIEASIALLPPNLPRLGICPSLLELADAAGDFGAVLAHTRAQGDLLAYTAALVKASGKRT
jgi:hypothetical protein